MVYAKIGFQRIIGCTGTLKLTMLPDLGYLVYCSRCITINDMSERWREVLRFAIKSKLAGVHIGLVVRSKWYFIEGHDAVVPWWNAEYCCRA